MTASENKDHEFLDHRIGQLPDHVRYHAKNGFKILGAITNRQLDDFLRAYFSAAEAGGVLDSETVDRILELDERHSSDAVLAISLAMGAVTDLSVSPDDFLDVGRDKVFDSADQKIVKRLLIELIERRAALRETLERSSIAEAILPSYQTSTVEIDLRLRFDDEENVTGGAAVAIIGIKTDIEDSFYFQLGPDELRRFIKRLEEGEGKLRASGKLLSGLLK